MAKACPVVQPLDRESQTLEIAFRVHHRAGQRVAFLQPVDEIAVAAARRAERAERRITRLAADRAAADDRAVILVAHAATACAKAA